MALPTRGITAAGSLDKGHDHRAPEGSLDGELGLPEDFLVVGGLQRGELLDLINKVVALQEHEKGNEEHQDQVEEEVSEAFDQAYGIGVDEGAGPGQHRLDDGLQLDLLRRQGQVEVVKIPLDRSQFGRHPLPEVAVLQALAHSAGKFQSLAGNDGQQAEMGDEDDEGQDQASEGRGQGPPPPEQPAPGQIQGLGKILNS